MNMMYTDERSLFQRAALKQRPREPVFSLADGLVSQMAASRVRQQAEIQYRGISWPPSAGESCIPICQYASGSSALASILAIARSKRKTEWKFSYATTMWTKP